MGWHGKPRHHAFRLGSTVDAIIERAPCNVVILKDCGNRSFKRILVPLGDGPNKIFALEVASILAEKDNSEIVAFRVNDGNGKDDIVQDNKHLAEQTQIYFDRIQTKHVTASNIVEAILEEAQAYDLLIIGSSQDPIIHKVTKESISYSVAERYQKSLIIVKASTGIRSWIKRWL
jgi:nucleotide-binding universal stress UspA family protein